MASIDPTDQTVDELRDELQSVDDPEALREIREAETDGDDRETALEAIDERLETVEDSSDGEATDDSGGSSSAESSSADLAVGDGGSIVEVRNAVRDVAEELIGRQLDGVIEVSRVGEGDGWRAVVEVVERHSVPNTQDILGRYEIDLSTDGDVEGYRRLDRYRRSDTSEEGV